MAFHVGYAWTVAATGIIVLVFMGIHNRQSLRKPERSNAIDDILMLWARTVAADQNAGAAGDIRTLPVTTRRSPSTVDLLALHGMLSSSSAGSSASDEHDALNTEKTGDGYTGRNAAEEARK